MAKKKSVKQTLSIDNILNQDVGYLNLKLYVDGTYEIDTNIQPEFVMLYANMLADLNEGKVSNRIINTFASSKNKADQSIAILIAAFLKQLKQLGKPLITPDRVFKKKTK